MVDKYGTGQDPNCYSGTSVLINLLNITNDDILEEAEREITIACAETIEFQEPPYDLDYLCAIHQTLFCDIYEWAGKIRTLDISKGDTHFCNTRFIDKEADKLFTAFADNNYFSEYDKTDLICAVSELYGELNMVHPFREGNGRAQRILFEHIVINAGFEIYWESVSQEEWISANVAAVYCDYSSLETLFGRCIGDPL